jgi:hypothetical protein
MKKPIIVKESNYPRINAEIEAVEKRCTVRTIDNAETIAKALAEIENQLDIPKKYMKGIEADIDLHAQTFPNCYKGRPESTHFTATYTGTAWRLDSVARWYTRGKSQRYRVTLTEEAKKAIIDRMSEFE